MCMARPQRLCSGKQSGPISTEPCRAGAIPFPEVYRCATPADHARIATLASSLQFDEPVNIQFTSGTTGAPKGATLTHHNILNNGYFIGEAQRLTERDKVCI